MLTFEQAFELAEKAAAKAEAVYSQAKKILRGKKSYDYRPQSKLRREVDYLYAIYRCESDKCWLMKNHMRRIAPARYYDVMWYFRLENEIWDL